MDILPSGAGLGMLWQGCKCGHRAGVGPGNRGGLNQHRQGQRLPLVLQSRARPNWYALIAVGA